jgi:hypothetical protein
MKLSWTKGLDEQLAKDVVQNFKEAVVMRRRMKTILLSKIEASAHEGRAKDLYESPSWPYLQADKRGYERAMEEIIDLISDVNVNKE